MRRFAYIINPISGTSGKESLQGKIEQLTTQAGFTYDIFYSVKDGNYSFLHGVIKEKGITDVIIAGGDGTINQVLNNLRHLDVQFGILPCGSGNGLAFSAGVPKNIEKALQIIFVGKSVQADAFLINNHFACMLCGLGFDAQVAHSFANDPNRGLSTYVKKSVSHFFSAHAYPFELQFNGMQVELEAFFISIANSNQFGNHFTIAPQASLTDGLVDIVIVNKQNKWNLLMQTALQVTGYNKLQQVELLNKNASIIYFQTDAITITNKGFAPMHMDGDPITTAATIDMQILKGCYQLIVP
jgi:diacylglycerol kinase (ATP)